MLPDKLKKTLRFCFVTDQDASVPPEKQAVIVMQAGATMIRYCSKPFTPSYYQQAETISNFCKSNAIPIIISGNVLLAKAIMADGVHLGQDDASPEVARNVLGPRAIIGVSVAVPDELQKIDTRSCDYIQTGPVFSYDASRGEKKSSALYNLLSLVKTSPLPVMAAGGIDSSNAKLCFINGAAGVAVKRFISRSANPGLNAGLISSACGCRSRFSLEHSWDDEFALIDKLLSLVPSNRFADRYLKISPGDDAALLAPVKHPVITTDTQKEDVHFCLSWQTPEEIGSKAVEVTFSDLAACYATPISLFVNLSLPAYISNITVERIYKGIKKALLRHKASLGGGNISRSDRLSIDLFAIGCGAGDIFPARGNALAGDFLYSTGPLGLARAGLEALIRKDAQYEKLMAKFISPVARFDAARILAENRVASVIDVSDGLAGDALHIAKASNISIEFNLASSVKDDTLVSFCKKYNLVPEELIFGGGEDYELLFACSADKFENINKLLPDAFKVGRCLEYAGQYLINLPTGVSSYQHGKNADYFKRLL